MQDVMKMRVRKLSDEISQKDSSDMVRYARNAIEEFRRAKREKNILFWASCVFLLGRTEWIFAGILQMNIFIGTGELFIEGLWILDSDSCPSELLEMCELIIDKMGSVFDNSNVYMLHMMYQAMGVCLFTENYDGAVRYGEKVLKQYM